MQDEMSGVIERDDATGAIEVDRVVAGFRRLSTAAVSDALDAMSIPGAALGISALLAPGTVPGPVAGRAFTVGYRPAGREPETVGDFIDDVEPGQVVVIDNAGRLDCTVWGGIMTTVAVQRRLAATVIDGVCRDVEVAHRYAYPMFTAGRFMRTGKDRVELRDVGGRIAIGGVPVGSGDIVMADADGVLVVPIRYEAEVLERAVAITARESAIISTVADGTSLREARSQHAYHTLQRGG